MVNYSPMDVINIDASYSTLSQLILLEKLVPLYLQGAIKCEFWHRGVNDTYRVIAKNESYILRIYRKDWRTLSEIQFEVEALVWLKNRGASISYPIRNTLGNYVTALQAPEGLRYAILTTYAEGDVICFDEIQNAYDYGRSVASIHLLSDDFSTHYNRFKLDKKHLITDSVDNMKPFFFA